jgi:crotonobetainyl-CoA:carnitine CoA-transferase CaiB-like acyl-CoA transferase
MVVLFHPIAQAESGFMSLNGYSDRQRVRTLSPVMNTSTAMMACNAILGALLARGRTGARATRAYLFVQ